MRFGFGSVLRMNLRNGLGGFEVCFEAWLILLESHHGSMLGPVWDPFGASKILQTWTLFGSHLGSQVMKLSDVFSTMFEWCSIVVSMIFILILIKFATILAWLFRRNSLLIKRGGGLAALRRFGSAPGPKAPSCVSTFRSTGLYSHSLSLSLCTHSLHSLSALTLCTHSL